MGRHGPARIFVNPDLLSRRCVEGDKGAVLRQNVNDAANLDGVEKVARSVSSRIGPRNMQLAHVRAIDLFERGILGGIRRAAILMPGCMGIRKGRKTAEQCREKAVEGQTASIARA
jgi:hypothetical protein